MSDKNLLYEKIYKNTQGYGRTQLVELIQMGQIKIEQLQEENKELTRELSRKTTNNITLKKDRDYWQGIIKEFEKWLKEEYERKIRIMQNIRVDIERFKNLDAQTIALDNCCYKLRKLKSERR